MVVFEKWARLIFHRIVLSVTNQSSSVTPTERSKQNESERKKKKEKTREEKKRSLQRGKSIKRSIHTEKRELKTNATQKHRHYYNHFDPFSCAI